MLSLKEKVGQMMMAGFHGKTAPPHILEWLAAGRIGGIYLFARNIESPAQVKRLLDDCHAAAKYPILAGIDQEGGIVARLREGFTESPGAMALAAGGDTQLAEDIAAMMGRELAAIGINWNFAPVADIVHHADNPSVGTRSFGADRQLVSDFVTAQIRGLQGAGAGATVKHFPGLGNTVVDTHDTLAKVSGALDYLYEIDLFPFRSAIKEAVACVMTAHVIFEELDSHYPATLSPIVISKLLRGELGYEGAVCTDCMEMKAITDGWGAGESAVLSVLAGVDMPLFSHTRERQEAAYHALLEAVESGRIPMERLDRSVVRIQTLKRRFKQENRPPLDVVHSKAHQALAQKAARAGTVLLKQGAAFPVQSDAWRILCIEFSTQIASDAVEAGSHAGFSQYLLERIPQTVCHILNPAPDSPHSAMTIDEAAGKADIAIVATRNAHLLPAQAQLAQSIIDRAQTAILVCLRNPHDAAVLSGADTIICTHSDSRPSLQAAVDAICGDFTPTGRLTVEMNCF